MKQNRFLIILVLAVAVGGFGVYKWRMQKSVPQVQDSTFEAAESSDSVSSNESQDSGSEVTVSQIPLTVTSPATGSTVNSASVAVKGKTVPNAEVNVNDKMVKADSTGAFSANVALEEGDNTLIVMAVDEDGNSAETEVAVTYTPLP